MASKDGGGSANNNPHPLQLHAQIDALFRNSEWPDILHFLQRGYEKCTFEGRAEIQLRLRRLLHECVFTGSKNQAAWEEALVRPLVAEASALREGNTWSSVLTFAATLETQHLLAAVSHGFALAVRAPVVWEGHDVSFQEKHFNGLNRRGWCRALALLPCLVRARSLRLSSFRDSNLQLFAASTLQRASREFCSQVVVLPYSFCKEHCGEHIDLPSPRHLGAQRRTDARKKGGGLLLGTGPLQWDEENSRSFAVRLEVLSPGERLDIGVTAQAPFAHFASEATGRRRPQVAFAEDLLSSWVVESSGLLVGSHAGLRIRDERWNARSLCAGDLVRLTVMMNGELHLSVNGDSVAMWRAQIPCRIPIFPVVDLFEGAPQIRLEPLNFDGK
ncbi:unnamed protein product [Durusdinium trenchii]|uniref:NHR domain-containing protein n=2 Tax=Durusdinium trenchii TaxID=1381693 RepID=A0ABP0NHI4_9DINO